MRPNSAGGSTGVVDPRFDVDLVLVLALFVFDGPPDPFIVGFDSCLSAIPQFRTRRTASRQVTGPSNRIDATGMRRRRCCRHLSRRVFIGRRPGYLRSIELPSRKPVDLKAFCGELVDIFAQTETGP